MRRDRGAVSLPVAVRGIASLLTAMVAVPAGAAEGGGGLIELNGSLIIQIVNFLILLAVLYRFMYRPLVGALDNRSAAIKHQLAEAQQAREEAQRQLAAMEDRIRSAHAEAQATRDRALQDAAALRERLTAEARQEAGRLVEAAQAQIAGEVRRARAELRAEVGQLATELAERLIRKSLRDDDHQRLMREALARIEPA